MFSARYKKILRDFIDSYKHLPEQGTPKWAAERMKTIGGSEIGTVEGTNYYGKGRKGEGELIAGKIGISKFNKNVWMRMGNLYEDIVRQYGEKVFETTIYETGCIPGRQGKSGEVIQTFSPDGLGVTNVKQLIEYFGTAFPEVGDYLRSLEDDYNISLFEFKAPGARIPLGYWEPKTKGYHSQVLDGLDTIPIVNFGIYIDAVIRRCSLYNLGKNPVWNPASHMQKQKDLGEAQMCGFIGVYKSGITRRYNEEDPDLDNYIQELFKTPPRSEDFTLWLSAAKRGAEYFKAPQPDLIDFGLCDNDTFERMLINVVDTKCWSMYHSKLYLPGDKELFGELDKFEEDYNAIGLVPWKLFNAEIIPVIPQPGYVGGLMNDIERIITTVKTLLTFEPSERAEEFYKLYPECKPRYRKIPTTTTVPTQTSTIKSTPIISRELLSIFNSMS